MLARPRRWQTVVALFLLIVGFLVAAQLRSRQPFRQAATLPTWRLQELAMLVRQQEEARRRLQAEVDALRGQALDYEAALTEGRSLTEAMSRDLQRFRMVLGLVPVEGPGIQVILAPGAPLVGVLPAGSPFSTELQAQDLAGLANELWSAGAEAMAVNGVRILATTGIRQDGPRIMADGTALNPPFRVEAIGNPAALRAAMAIRGGFVEGLLAVGLRVEVKTKPKLRLPARTSVEPFRYSRPQVVQ